MLPAGIPVRVLLVILALMVGLPTACGGETGDDASADGATTGDRTDNGSGDTGGDDGGRDRTTDDAGPSTDDGGVTGAGGDGADLGTTADPAAGTDDGTCLTRLGPYLTDPEVYLTASDLERARGAGYDDAGPIGLEKLAEANLTTGVMPDPLSVRSLRLYQPLIDNGFQPADVACVAGDDQRWAALGSFDDGAVADSRFGREGRLATDGTVLIYDESGEAVAGLSASSPDGRLAAAVAAADGRRALSFTAFGFEQEGPITVVGTGEGDERGLLLLWVYSSEEAAASGLDVIVDAAEDDASRLSQLTDEDPAALLRQDGTVVSLEAPLAGSAEPLAWQQLLTTNDPVIALPALG